MVEQQRAQKLSLKEIKTAVKSAAAFRLRVKLGGMGGDGDKVFPPTYAGGVYAVEDRKIDGSVVRCALLDSVQSQANRMEGALLDAFLPSWRELDPEVANTSKEVRSDLPVLAVHIKNHGWVTSLTAPHRVHDAIIRDSEFDETVNGKKVRFRESTVGKGIVAARLHDATALYKYCPTALLFATWDSTAGEGLDSAKVPRAIVSEIIGVDITPGVRTGSRIDPLGIRAQSATVYRLKDTENDWTLDEEKATKKKNEKPERFGGGKPSDINHGNVTPDMPRFDQDEIRRQNLDQLPDLLATKGIQIRPGAVKPGGVTMAYALHTWTLSLTQLRRLRFPVDGSSEAQAAAITAPSEESAKRNEAARTVLAALALHALALQQEQGYWLRSRCELIPKTTLKLEQIGGAGGMFSLETAEQTHKILGQAIDEAEKLDLAWCKRVAILTPTDKLQELVRRSDAQRPQSEEGGEQAGVGAAG